MQVMIPALGVVNLPQDNYTNCHQFTRDVILGIPQIRPLNTIWQTPIQLPPNPPQPPINLLQQNIVNTKDIYDAMLNGATVFNKATLPNVPAPSLILFTIGGTVSHSMIAIGNNSWEGANNLSSLLAPDKKVHIYPNIDQYNYHQGASGGWDTAGQMRSVYGDQYTMYYIPL